MAFHPAVKPFLQNHKKHNSNIDLSIERLYVPQKLPGQSRQTVQAVFQDCTNS